MYGEIDCLERQSREREAGRKSHNARNREVGRQAVVHSSHVGGLVSAGDSF